MDKPANVANGAADASASQSQSPHPTLSRKSSASSALRADSSSQLSQHSTQTSRASPLPSREPSPSRPTLRAAVSKAASTGSGTRSRKNSQQDLSPSRQARSNIPSPAPTSRTLSSTSTPTLLPASVSSDSTIRAPIPQKSPTSDHLRDAAPRWPVSPRLRSPPPILNRPALPPPPRKSDQDPPSISIQRSTPSPAPHLEQSQSDTDQDDSHLQAGTRTPVRANNSSTSTLETVQEASPLASPQQTPQQRLDEALEKLQDRDMGEPGSQPDGVEHGPSKTLLVRTNLTTNESGSDGSIKNPDRRPPMSSVPPPLTSRQSSISGKATGSKGKPTEGTVQNMTVETETVTSIPQVSVAPATKKEESNASLRTKPSSETIRPKKEKKKTSRKQTTVPSGTGELPHYLSPSVYTPQLRHHHQQPMRSVSSATNALFSPTKSYSQGLYNDDASSPRRQQPSNTRSQSFNLYPPMTTLLTKLRTASSKADIFEAKVASAVDEANTSDSEETFVYDSNPPDGGDRPRRFHSRTPSATSMVSQVDRTGMRSINSIMESAGPSVAVKKNMKFVNTFNGSGNDSTFGDDEGKGTGRSNAAGSGRGTTRAHHHHIGRWGRNGAGNGHTSLFDNEAPFHINAAAAQRPKFSANNSRQSSGPPSPRFGTGRAAVNGKRGLQMTSGYDLDDTTGADDERTPLIHGSLRSARSRRNRAPMSMRALEGQNYTNGPSFLNRFASCLVLTVMLLLVVSGAIGFMFATSQPLTDIELVSMRNVLASEQELMFDLTVKAHNPNVVVVIIDSADLEIFAKSPHAGTDSEWWRRPHDSGTFSARRRSEDDLQLLDDPKSDPPLDDNDKAPNMRLGTIKTFDSPLSFEGSFFHQGISASTGEVRLQRPGNGTDGGSERWERILQDEFDLILKGVLKYSLPLSQRIRSVAISGRTTVKPNSANDPTLRPNSTDVSIS